MLKNKDDFSAIRSVVIYARMSSELQNDRSPDQQIENIRRTMERLGYQWRVDGVYRDNGVSGKLIRRRPGLQKLLTDVRTAAVKPDALLVDSSERLGRNDDMAAIRRELRNKYGVIILSADSNFSDPRTPSGKVFQEFESLRATEENRVKAHQCLRGKLDAVELGHWPGGNAPFGYRIRTVTVEKKGRTEVDHSVLEPDPETAGIVKWIYKTAADNGWGAMRVAQAFNESREIPEKHQPRSFSFIHFLLKNPIYVGVLVWSKVSTETIDDVRICEKNDEKSIVRKSEFCEPLIDRDVWDRVQAQIAARNRQKRKGDDDEKAIKPLTPGLAIKYPLTGLVICERCGRAMVVGSSPIYVTKNGEEKRYASYHCPASRDGVCDNKTNVSADWLWSIVVQKLKEQLFPGSN